MDRTRTERAAIGLLLLSAAFLCGLFVGRNTAAPELLQLPERQQVVTQMSDAPLEMVEQRVTVLDLNAATAEELDSLPGIGPVIAERIIAYREENGPYVSVEELLAVQGIGEKTLSELREYLTAGSPASESQEVQK